MLLAILPARVRHIAGIKVVLLLKDLTLSIHGKTVRYAQRRLWIDSVDFSFRDDGRHRLIDVMFNKCAHLPERESMAATTPYVKLLCH